MTSDYTVLDSAYEIYLRDKSPSAGLALCRALRLSGHAEEAIRVLKELADSVDDPFFRAQIGIDMNLLGLFSQAEPLLSQSLSVLHHEPDRRALTAELLISQYAQGRFREAHTLNRRSRDAWGRAGVVSNIYPSHTSEYQRIVNKLLRCDESVAGKRVLIIQEGGLGDVLMFPGTCTRYGMKVRRVSYCRRQPYSLRYSPPITGSRWSRMPAMQSIKAIASSAPSISLSGIKKRRTSRAGGSRTYKRRLDGKWRPLRVPLSAIDAMAFAR
ncbi:tetratricopeptide repeat protein [Burkholderia cenocepacia]|uniref:tetratricopeptide repeat protein n=1 Tax=Burkholderia cenocepacia TaxID=95486 RepID=UPI00187D2A59|nr:hypothetical protein [Burkholderia cenocepacia]